MNTINPSQPLAAHHDKDLTLTLQPTLSSLAIRQDFGINIDDSGSISSNLTTMSSISSPYCPPTPSYRGIELHVAHWARYSQHISSLEGNAKVSEAKKILQFFSESADQAGLAHSPCTEVLREAIGFAVPASKTTGAQRVVHKTRATAPTHVNNLRDFVVNSIPIFNVFEALCWLYTYLIDPSQLRNDRDVELFLYQLGLIMRCLTKTAPIWAAKKFIPSTIAAAWTKPTGQPLIVAFACSCVAAKPSQKSEAHAARQAFLQSVHALVGNTWGQLQDCRNAAGNCPEFLTWGSICRPGKSYRSLCLSRVSNMAYRCCQHCEQWVQAAVSADIMVHDWYDKTSIAILQEQEEDGYEGYKLKNTALIIREGRRGRQS